MFSNRIYIKAGLGQKKLVLLGTTQQLGTDGQGSIFMYDLKSAQYTTLHSFLGASECQPRSQLLLASNGKLYGTTRITINPTLNGNIFEYDLQQRVYTNLFNFNLTTTGTSTEGALTQASNGKIYGVCRFSGVNGVGTLWEYEIGVGFTKLRDFIAASGSSPVNAPIQASDGKLYGTTISGTVANSGVIYQYDIGLASYTVLRTFTTGVGGGGAQPIGGIIQASNGLFYGVTNQGGTNNVGVIYSFNPTTLAYTVLHNAASATGSAFQSKLKEYDGVLYSTSNLGGANNLGVLFSYNIGTSTYTKIFDFTAASGNRPLGGDILKSGDNIYVGLASGGSNSRGTILQYNLKTNQATVLHNFVVTTGSAGGPVYGELILMEIG